MSGKNHSLIIAAANRSFERLGVQFEKIGVYQKKVALNQNGQLTAPLLKEAISPKTAFLSMEWANPLTGVIHPIWELAELCKEEGILFHVDGSAALGKSCFKFQDLPIDFLTFDGPSIHGPKGSGALFAQSKWSVDPEEEGELNTAALIGLSIAAQRSLHSFDHLCTESARLRDRLERGVTSAIDEAKVLFSHVERLPNVSVICFPGVMQELLAFHLREKKLFASFGTGKHQSLHSLLIASGTSSFEAQCALSFSLCRESTEEQIDRAIAIIVECAKKCLTFSKGVFR